MKHQHRATVSVIIPTLQKAVELDSLVRDCAAHPAVLEVIVVNNAAAPLAWDHAKVRVLAQGENIYVNPANKVVIVTFGAQPKPVDKEPVDPMVFFDAVVTALK